MVTSRVSETAGRRGSITRPKKTAVILAQRIVHDIVSSGMPLGTMLPPEHEMADELGVGRATLREALRYLELQGVLAMRAGPRGGPMVAPPSARPLASTFALVLAVSGTPFADIIAARVALEPVLAAQAARCIDDAHIEALQEVCDEMVANIKSADVFLEVNRRFHDLVAQSSGNRVLEYTLSSLSWISDGSSMGIAYPIRQRRAVAAAHQRILDALKRRDAEAAQAAMCVHMVEFESYVARRYPEIPLKTVDWGDHYI